MRTSDRQAQGAFSRLGAAVAIVAAATPLQALATAPTPPSGPALPTRVLPPDAGPRLEAAFARAAPALRLDGAALDRDVARAKVCDAAGCYELELRDGEAQCPGGEVAGAFCLTWRGPPPAAAAAVAALRAALAADPADAFWRTIAARPPQPAIVPPAEAPRRYPGPATATSAHEPPAPATEASAIGGAVGPDAAPTAAPPAAGAEDAAAPAKGRAGRWLWLSLLVAAVAFWGLRRRGRDGDRG